MDAKQFNLQELVVALSQMEETIKDITRPVISMDLQQLIAEGLHHSHMPETLQDVKAAEAFQLAFEAIGGLPRLALWADRYPAAFYKLLARQTIPTIAPVLPAPELKKMDEWPDWVTHRRLAYQEASKVSQDIVDQAGTGDPGAVGGE